MFRPPIELVYGRGGTGPRVTLTRVPMGQGTVRQATVTGQTPRGERGSSCRHNETSRTTGKYRNRTTDMCLSRESFRVSD